VSALNYADTDYVPAEFRLDRLNKVMM